MSRLNLILTNVCNKKCSFCFASKITNLKKNEMSLDFIKQNIVEAGNIKRNNQFYIEQIALLGGEPTIYSNIVEVIDFLYNYNLACLKINKEPLILFLISNFLFKNPAVARALKNYSRKFTISYLINVSELNPEQKEITLNNIKNSLLPTQPAALSFTCSTLFDFSYYENILNAFYEEIIKKAPIETQRNFRIRVSVPGAAPDTKGINDIMLNKEKYLSQVDDFIKWGLDRNIVTGIDCGLFCCLFDKDKEKLFGYMEKCDAIFGCGVLDATSYDLYSDGTLRGCFCAHPYLQTSINNFQQNKLNSAMIELEKQQKNFIEKSIPPLPCRECELFLNVCRGPCVGYYDLKENAHLINNKDFLQIKASIL